jgi:hypothetical protein
MCYELYLSTSSSEELTEHNSELLRFERREPSRNEIAGVLLNPQRWFVGSKSGCSCTFRHLAGGDLGFDEPQDWSPEDQDNVRATAELYRVIASLVGGGNRVDCVDLWPSNESAEFQTLSVSLAKVPEKAFRLFENYRFVFEP